MLIDKFHSACLDLGAKDIRVLSNKEGTAIHLLVDGATRVFLAPTLLEAAELVVRTAAFPMLSRWGLPVRSICVDADPSDLSGTLNFILVN